MKTKTRFLTPVLFACLSLASTAHAATVTWTGTTGGDWDTGANWSGSAKPLTADLALFNTALASVTNAVADQTVRQISFDTNAGTASGNFTLGTTGGNNLTLNSGFATQVGTQILSTLTGTGKTISINAPIVLTPASPTTAGAYTFANNSTSATNTLNFGGAISSGLTSNTTTLTLLGANKGTNTISGAITNGSATTFGVTKGLGGAGTWILSGANTYNGGTAIQNGILQLNAGAGGSLNSASTLSFANYNGTFILDNTGASGAINQSLTMGSISGGDAVIQINRVAAQNLTLTLSALAFPSNQATLNYVTSGTPGVNGTDSKIVITGRSAGTLGNNFYFNGSNFARYDAAGYVRGINYGVDGSSATSAGTTSIANPATWQQVTGAVTAQNTAAFPNLLISGANDFTLAASQTVTLTSLIKSGGGATTISGGSGITLGAANNYFRVDSASDSLTVSNAIGGTGSRFVKSGKGTLILSGSNTYSSNLIVNDGVVNIQNANALGTTAGSTTVGGALQIQGGITVTGETLGLGGMGMNNDGALRNISGDNTWAGNIATNTDLAARINSDSGTLTISGNIALGGSGVGNLDNLFGGAGDISVSGNITGNGPRVIKDGSGTLSLSGVNTWVSGFTIQEGVVSIATITNAFTSGPLGSNNNAINMGGTSTAGTLSYTGSAASSTIKFTMNAGGGNFEVTTAPTVLTLSGQIGGSGGLTKSGPGTLRLTSSNFWGGRTTINGGTLQIAASNRIGNSPQLTLNGGTLYTVGAGSTLTLNSGSGVELGSGGGTFQTDSGTPLTIQGVISGSGSLTKTDTGTLTLSGTNTYSGDTIVSEGVLAVSGNSIANANKLVIAGGQVDLTGTETVGTLFFGGVQQAAGSYTSADPSTNFTGGGTLIVSNGPGSGNTNPTITDIANQSVPSGGNTGALAFTVGDAETAVGSLSVSGSSSNTGLVPNGNIVFGGSGASRTVTVTPVSGLSGSATITITVTDGGALTAQDTFTLTVTDNYLSWATLNGVTGGPNGDSDNDGVKNLVEYALVNGGERGVFSGNTITYTKRGAPYGTDLTYIIETSETLVGAWTDAVTHGPGLLVSNPTISYTFTPSTPVKKFARLEVIQN
jgi:autotransporter-associated beta strand protein